MRVTRARYGEGGVTRHHDRSVAQRTVIVGPVFAHEVVGFSGGQKYLSLGCPAGDHRPVALVAPRSSAPWGLTQVRALIDEAASLDRVTSSPCAW